MNKKNSRPRSPWSRFAKKRMTPGKSSHCLTCRGEARVWKEQMGKKHVSLSQQPSEPSAPDQSLEAEQ